MTKRPILNLAALVITAAAGLGTFAAPQASAQTGSSSRKVEKLEPPTPGTAKPDGIVWPMIMGMVVAGAALTVNLIPSKRGHQD
jgi:hypothetical protein